MNSFSEAAAREEAQKQWNANPCGALPTEEYDLEFFRRVEADRYRQQYWQRGFFDYSSFSGRKVLEIGTGLGTDLKQFARHGAECYGVDITDRHLELTRLNLAAEGLPVQLVKADATALPFDDESFDCVHSFGVLHHIPDVEDVLREIRRVLKPGGVLQCAVYNLYSFQTGFLFLHAAVKGKLFRLGVNGVLGTIERGADGIATKPFVRLYSKRRWRRTVAAAGFRTEKVAIRQLHDDTLRLVNWLRPLEGLLGWYVCGKFKKTVR